MHARDYIHRDIKPSNILLGRRQQAQHVFIIDFGLAVRYHDPITHFHIPYRSGRQLTGTARWASINTHIGIEQSRRDDLESLAYVLIYLLRGSLPWQNLTDDARILSMKQSLSPDALCDNLPPEFGAFLSYVRGLAFEANPDYAYLHGLLRLLARCGASTQDIDSSRSSQPAPNGLTSSSASEKDATGADSHPRSKAATKRVDASQISRRAYVVSACDLMLILTYCNIYRLRSRVCAHT